jgi:hypothetical protein
VFKALKDGVQPVAVKVFPQAVAKDVLREVGILKTCRDNNVVQFLGAVLEAGQVGG